MDHPHLLRQIPLFESMEDADLVAVDNEHVGAARGQLTRYRETRKACAADQDIAVAIQRRPLVASLRGATWHGGSMIRRRRNT